MSGPAAADRSPAQVYADELRRFADDLTDLHISCGKPPLRTLSSKAPGSRKLSPSAISEVLTGKRLPRLDFLVAVVRIMLSYEAGQSVASTHPDVETWRARWMEMERLRKRSTRHQAVPDPSHIDPAPAFAVEAAVQAEILLEEAGARAMDIVAEAETEADAIRARERARAEVAAEDAERAKAMRMEAEILLEEARARAMDIVAEAEREADTILAAARKQAEAILARARTQDSPTAESSEGAPARRPDTPFPNGRKPKSDAADAKSGSSRPAPRTRRGQDTKIRLEVTLEEAAFGTTKDVKVDTAVICDVCRGDGCAPGTLVQTCNACEGEGNWTYKGSSYPCPFCKGTGALIPFPCAECAGEGRVPASRTLSVKIPAGVDSGTRIQLGGEGEVGPRGGPAGDIYLELAELPHHTFQRKGDDIHSVVFMPLSAGLRGTHWPLLTLEGIEEIKIPPGTVHGQSITLPGRGVTHLRGGGRGDLIVHIKDPTPATRTTG